MRKLAVMFLSIFVFLSACSNTEQPKEQESLLKQSWKDIEAEAKNKTVRMFMWGGDDGINRYMDEWVAPRLKKEYGITFERVPMDANEILKKLLSEKKANKEKGTIDIIWINGENFKNAKDHKLLFGPITEKLPNFQNKGK